MVAAALVLATFVAYAAAYNQPRSFFSEVAEVNEFPSVGFMLCNRGEGLVPSCTVNVVTSRWLLTAGHCMTGVYDRPKAVSAEVYVGSNGREEGTRHKVVNVQLPLEFDIKTFTADIALVKVEPPIKLGDTIEVATLPDSRREYSKRAIGVVPGWGYMEDGSIPWKLMKYHVTNLAYKGDTIEARGIMDQASCLHDGGSPLIVNGVTIGLLTIVRPIRRAPDIAYCNGPNIEVFVNIATYMDWIKEVIAK